MATFWKVFWWCMGSLGAVVALYIGAEAEGYEWAFWLVLGGSLATALAWALGPRAFKWADHIREYPVLLQRAGELQKQNQDLMAEKSAAEARLKDQWTLGVAEGRAQIYGALKAQSMVAAPALVGAGIAADGEPHLLGKCTTAGVLVGARFEVEVLTTGAVKGVVEARDYDPSRQIVALMCVEATSPEFWKKLAERAELDPSPPPGVGLRPMDVEVALPPGGMQGIEPGDATEVTD